MKNDIQVYGLPRSGTNLLEWSLVNNFKDVVYENKYKVCDVEGIFKYGKYIAAKHSYPSFEFSDKVVVIYKEFHKWEKSYKKWSKQTPEKQVWENYIKKSESLDTDKCIIITHKELNNDYQNTLNKISNKFGFKLKDIEITKPINYMDRGGAESEPLKNKIYHYE